MCDKMLNHRTWEIIFPRIRWNLEGDNLKTFTEKLVKQGKWDFHEDPNIM